MQKLKPSKALLFLLLVNVISAVVLAQTVFYTLTVPTTATVLSSYGLELWITAPGSGQVVLTSYSWGGIHVGESKSMVLAGATNPSVEKLKNTGTILETVTWRTDANPAYFSVDIKYDTTDWVAGSTKDIAAGGWGLDMIITLHCIGYATGLQTINLIFEVVGP